MLIGSRWLTDVNKSLNFEQKTSTKIYNDVSVVTDIKLIPKTFEWLVILAGVIGDVIIYDITVPLMLLQTVMNGFQDCC